MSYTPKNEALSISSSEEGYIEALNFGFKKKRECVIHVAKTMEMISCTFTAQLICAFVYAYASCLFYDVVAKMNITS